MLSMARNLDITLVRTFVTAADSASMTVAANSLHLTQGAVSQQIRRLEEALGCTLFERDRRGLGFDMDDLYISESRVADANRIKQWVERLSVPTPVGLHEKPHS